MSEDKIDNPLLIPGYTSLIPPLVRHTNDLEYTHLKDSTLKLLAYDNEVAGASRAMQDLYRKSYQYQISEGKFDFIPSIKFHRAIIDQYESKFNKPHGYLITINPRPDIDAFMFKKKIDKFLDKTWVHDGVISNEFRDEKGDGYHVHCYVRYNGKRYSQVIEETYNTFKNYVGNKMHVNVKRIRQPDEDQVVKYVIKDGDYTPFGVFKDILPPPLEIVFEE